jgi:hypothetical protein
MQGDIAIGANGSLPDQSENTFCGLKVSKDTRERRIECTQT